MNMYLSFYRTWVIKLYLAATNFHFSPIDLARPHQEIETLEVKNTFRLLLLNSKRVIAFLKLYVYLFLDWTIFSKADFCFMPGPCI